MTDQEKYRKLVFRIETLEKLINVLWFEYWDERGEFLIEQLDSKSAKVVSSLMTSIRDHNYTLSGLRRRKSELGEQILKSIEKGEIL